MDILIYGTPIVALIYIVIEVAKRLGLEGKYQPLVSILAGIVFIAVGSWTISPELVISGIIAGAFTSGLFDNYTKGKEIITGK